MKCSEFEMIVSDLASGRVKDEVELERALLHTTSCPGCAVRLADERSLSAGLKALAKIEESRMAPQSVEMALSAYFRKNIVDKTEKAEAIRWSRIPGWAWVTAAAVLVGLSLIAAGIIRQESDKRPEIVERPTPAPPETIVHQPGKQSDITNNHKLKRVRKPKRTGQVIARKKPVVPISDRVMIMDEMTLYISEQEITTDFLPVYYTADTRPMDYGQLIRVRMPRSALLKFGLPMNFEQANVPVKADLLIGEDGLAQAIRFVR
jgi:hypothetical protein